MSLNSSSVYRPEIDGLRAIAVSIVILYHIDLFDMGKHGGFVGVDIFFVISGFLITNIIVNDYLTSGKFSFSKFYLHRMRRLLPVLFVTLAITWIGSFLLLSLPHFQHFNLSLIAASLNISNLFFITESGYFDNSSLYKPLLHTWSLGVEIQFYLIWPLLVFFLLKFIGSMRAFFVLQFLGILSLGSAIIIFNNNLQILKNFDTNSFGFYFMPFRIYEFMIGGALVWLIQFQPKSKFFAESFFILGFTLICAATFEFKENMDYPSYNALLPCLGSALIIYSKNANFSKKILLFYPINYIGKISYSLYLCHWPIIILYGYYIKLYSLQTISEQHKYIILAIILLVGSILFKYVEVTFRIKQNKNDATIIFYRSFLIFPILSLFLIGIGYLSIYKNGWPNRTNYSNLYKSYGNIPNFFNEFYGGINCGAGCERNPKTTPRTWVLGDSHSMHLESGLMHFFPDRNFTFIWNKCRFYSLDFCAAELGSESVTEIARKHDTLKTVSKTFDNVIISHFWYHIITSGYKTDSNVRYSYHERISEFAERSVIEFKKMKSYLPNNHITVIGALPYYSNENPVDCLTYPNYFARRNQDCSRNLVGSQWQVLLLNAELEMGLKGSGITFINPTSYFCDTLFCYIYRNNQILFSDSSHLSIDGSIYFIDQIMHSNNGSQMIK